MKAKDPKQGESRSKRLIFMQVAAFHDEKHQLLPLSHWV
jgi:hypothetical protein